MNRGHQNPVQAVLQQNHTDALLHAIYVLLLGDQNSHPLHVTGNTDM